MLRLLIYSDFILILRCWEIEVLQGSCPVNALTIQIVEGSCPGMPCHSNALNGTTCMCIVAPCC